MNIRATVIMCAAGLMLAAPAFAATTSLAKGEKLCKTAISAQTPAPASVRVDDGETRTSKETIWFKLKTKSADGAAGVVACTVNRTTAEVAIAAE